VRLDEEGKALAAYGYKEGMVLGFKDLGPQIGYRTGALCVCMYVCVCVCVVRFGGVGGLDYVALGSITTPLLNESSTHTPHSPQKSSSSSIWAPSSSCSPTPPAPLSSTAPPPPRPPGRRRVSALMIDGLVCACDVLTVVVECLG
jgi:hypothetical protein